jgi:TldD protein
MLEEAKLLDKDNIEKWLDKLEESFISKPFDEVGEYEVVFDGEAMAAIVDGTFGSALEYDRAVGYEANIDGTSYLAPPLTVLGTSRAPAAVNITADRTLPRGTATVSWDDEGVAVAPFQLVKDGVVMDYASSREFTTELAPWYQRQNAPVRSNGCAASESAFCVPMVGTPNLILHPAAQDNSLDAMVSSVKDGLLICGGDVRMDFQKSGGRGEGGTVYSIKNGKASQRPISDAVYVFSSQDLWKKLVTLGGASTATLHGLYTSKGQPDQSTVHSVQSVPAHFSKIRVANTDHS